MPEQFKTQFEHAKPPEGEKKAAEKRDEEESPLDEPIESGLMLIKETKDSVFYLGVEVKKGKGGENTPDMERFKDNVLTDYDLRLMQKIAVGFSLNQPLLIEGGSGLGKTETVERMCAQLNRESYYANCHDFDPDVLIGAKTTSEETKSGFGWKDGIVTQAIRNGGVLFLDEYNFMRGDTRGRMHEILDSILRGKKEIILIENDGERVPVHPDFRLIAAQNPPGGEFGDREVLDPAQLTRFNYIKEPTELPAELKKSRALGFINRDNLITIGEEEYLTQGAELTREQLAEIPGIEEIIEKYLAFAEAAEKMVKERKIAEDAPQPLYFSFQRDFNRVMRFVQNFYNGDISETMQKALRYYYVNKVEDEIDKKQIEELIRKVEYKPRTESKRKGLERKKKLAEGAAEAKLEGEIAEQISRAKEILGEKEVMGPAEAEKAFGIRIEAKDIPKIPFKEKDLERAKELGQFLVLRVAETGDGEPLTIKKMNEILKGKVKGGGKALYSDDGTGKLKDDCWYKNEDFALKETPRMGWALTSKEVILNSTNKNYLDQTAEIVDYVKNSVFKDEELPADYQEAIEEFEEQKEEIKKLIKDDWEQAAEKLENLKITKLTRQRPSEALYDILVYFQNNNERLLENKYTWTRRRDSVGHLVHVGNFDSDGADVFSYTPDHSYGGLGVSFSRSH